MYDDKLLGIAAEIDDTIAVKASKGSDRTLIAYEYNRLCRSRPQCQQNGESNRNDAIAVIAINFVQGAASNTLRQTAVDCLGTEAERLRFTMNRRRDFVHDMFYKCESCTRVNHKNLCNHALQRIIQARVER